jgi:RHS repeat-associated protein
VAKVESDFTDCYTYNGDAIQTWASPYTDCRDHATATREFDYGMLLKRSTVNSYLHQSDSSYDQAHLWDRLAETKVYAGAASGTPAAWTINTYGSSVTATSGVPYHDAVSGPRGNLMSVARWKSDSNTWPTTTHAYNDVGNVISTTDPGGHTTSFDYTDNFTDGQNRNSQGFLTKVTLPQTGSVQHIERKQYFWYTGLTAAECGQNYPVGTLCAWNSNAAPTNSDHFVFSYDALNRPLTVKNSGGGSRSIQYFADHARLEKAVPAGTYAQTVYWDGLGRVTQSQINSATPYPIYQDTYYDALGRVWKTSAPYYSNEPIKGYITRTEYDALGRVVKVTTDADGNYSTVAYFGNETISTDQTLRKHKSYSDAQGRLTSVWETDPGNSNLFIYETVYGYDALDNFLSVQQKGNDANSANWRTRTFTYNSLSQLLTAYNPESGVISYTYDNDGNVATKTDARGIITCYGSLNGSACTPSYDELHRMKDKTLSDGTQNSSYVYDASSFWGVTVENPVGRRIASTAAAGSLGSIVSYDVMGRPKKTWECPPSGCVVSEATYNLDGSMAWLKYPSGRKVTFAYDPAARQTGVTFNDFNGTAVNYPYWSVPASYASLPGFHPSGSAQWVVAGNGLISRTNLDTRLRPSSMSATIPSPYQDIIYRSYTYQANGNVSQITDNLDPARNQTFTYDQLNRITSTEEGIVGNSSVGRWGHSYTIDAWGNLTQQIVTKGNPVSFSASVNANNQLNSTGYAHDAAGNMTQNGSATYTYDGESRITAAGGYTYTYDANGMRVRKYQTASPNNWTEYIYFGSDVIAEKDQANTWTDYIFAGGKRIAKAPGVIATTGTEYYHSDHLGSARLMTNAQGTVVPGSEGTFLPYGQEYALTTHSNHYKFTGKERDSESNLDYFGARYYGATMGRWLTPDWSDEAEPVPYVDFTDPQTLNLYGYVGNRPITNVDDDGHVIETLWDVANVLYGAYSFGKNIAEAKYKDAAIDAGGILVDTAAVLLPGIPGGAGAGIKAGRKAATEAAETLAEKRARGLAKEAEVLKKEGLEKNTKTFEAVDPKTGVKGGTIPDNVKEGRTLDVKHVKTLKDSAQLRRQSEVSASNGKKARVIITERTQKVSKTVAERMDVKKTK